MGVLSLTLYTVFAISVTLVIFIVGFNKQDSSKNPKTSVDIKK